MSRIIMIWLGCLSLCGCAQFHGQSADCPCDDCLPPAVAGRFCYHRYLDCFLTKCTAQKCATRDLKQFDCTSDEEHLDLSRDFRDGYTQAYIDLAAGRPACVPAIPPQKYWHAWHRSCAGRDAVDQWFAGYRNGLDNGTQSGVSRFNRVVPNTDGCCVSAAYINPYATAAPTTPTGIQPADRQTISREPIEAAEEVSPAAAVDPVPQIVPADQSAAFP